MFELLSIMGNPKPYSGFYVQDVSGSVNTVSIKKSGSSAPTLIIETSLDGKAWSTLGTTSNTNLNIQVPANGRVYIRSNATSWGTQYSGSNYFSSTGNFKVGGNIMSLLYGSAYTGEETTFPSGSTATFCNLFQDSTYLQDASNLILPATTTVNSCYMQMFYHCNSLRKAPVLPATTLTQQCYMQMFYSCFALTSAPILSATTMAQQCYAAMFQNCANLTTAPELPATTLAMSCYNNMFSGCTALTTAPELPATTLALSCYDSMFRGCTSLTTAPVLPAATFNFGYNFYRQMFYGCTSLTTAPALPIAVLQMQCYQEMFKGCTSLNSVTCLATDISASNCTQDWLSGVSATGTFYKSPNMSSWTTGANGIPSGWTVVDAS